MNNQNRAFKPSAAFISVSWLALGIGISAYLVGLYNARIDIMEKGFYFTILLFALFSVISIQKSVRDRLEGVVVTDLYYALCWTASFSAVTLLVIGLWNAQMSLSEKGFYGMAFFMSLFAAIAIQKNTRDSLALTDYEIPSDTTEDNSEL